MAQPMAARERIAGRLDADRAERRRQGGIVTDGRLGEHVRGRLGDEFGRLALVEHGEARRHVRLERHKVQEALAEGVDRLDLEAAGGLDGAGEEAPRQLHLSGARPLAFELRQLGDQLRLGERHPASEPLEDANRHVGGGRLGEGEAQEPARMRARQQEAHDAVGQDLGLARAGIGRHPGGGARVGGAALLRDGVIRDDDVLAHRSASHPSSLP